jgi:flagellar protein FlaF
MPTSALDVYQSAQRVAISGRDLEAALLFKAARQLEAVVRSWDAADRKAQLRAALEYNTRLWSVFHASMEDPDSQLPREVRLNLLQLVRFIDRRTLEILTSPTAAKVQALIDIDRNIAMGLSAAANATSSDQAGGAAA